MGGGTVVILPPAGGSTTNEGNCDFSMASPEDSDAILVTLEEMELAVCA